MGKASGASSASRGLEFASSHCLSDCTSGLAQIANGREGDG